MLEFTYVMIKPDGVEKGIFEDVLDKYFAEGLDVVSATIDTLTKETAQIHYDHLKDKDFFKELIDFMVSGPVIKMLVVGEDAIRKVREINGPTNVSKAKKEAPNSIRALYGDENFGPANAIHASDSKENACVEIKRFFGISIHQPEEHIQKNANIDRPKRKQKIDPSKLV